MTKSKKLPARSGNPSLYSDAKGSIRDAALKKFAQHGFEATSVAEIAKAAGVPKANVLYYYSGKEELWKEAVYSQWERVDSYFSKRLPVPLPASLDGLATFLTIYLEACRAFPAYVQFPNLEGHADT